MTCCSRSSRRRTAYCVQVLVLQKLRIFCYVCKFDQIFTRMQGLSLSSLKKNPSLIPLYVCLGAGVAGAIFYTIRLATKSPEAMWNRKNNPEPWNEYANKQYKFYSPVRDYSKIESPAPKYQD